MAQDQIAKLMAIAGRTPGDDTGAPAASANGNDSQHEAPPPLAQKAPGAASSVAVQVANDAPARRVARRRPAGPVRGKIAANDDVPSIGGLIYALEQKPSTRIFRIATISSIIWSVVGIAYGAFTLVPQWSAGA
ncbi:MAG: hypothetical protein ABL893_09860, partial [Hyphomicrobium sp.]